MLRSIIHVAFFALLLAGCDDGCQVDGTKKISIIFTNDGDDNIHLFTKIYYIDNDGNIQIRLLEDFDEENKLAPGQTRILRDVVLNNFDSNVAGQPKFLYYIDFYAGQSGVVFKSVKNMSIASGIREYGALWDGENLKIN